MKIFSRALLAFIIAATAAPLAQATVTTVSGNVYDVGKYSYSKDSDLWLGDLYIGKGDSATCWAAAASNILQYWQDEYYDSTSHKNLSNVEAPNGISNSGYTDPQGTGSLNIYDYLLNNWQNGSGDPINVYTWWMQGRTGNAGATYTGTGSQPSASSSGGAFYRDVFMPPSVKYPELTNTCFYSESMVAIQHKQEGEIDDQVRPDYANLVSAIKSAFGSNGQAATVKVVPDGGTGHVISCWGYEEDENGDFYLIMTDSDDGKFGAFMVKMVKTEDGKACIQTDRRQSWYNTGAYEIADVAFITTPDTIAHVKTEAASITSLAAPVTASGTIKQELSSNAPVVFGDGNSPIGVLVTSTEKGSITVNNADSSHAGIAIQDGTMLLLNGGVSVTGAGKASAAGESGIMADGQLYVHGGNVSVTANSAAHSGGGIYACGIIGKTGEAFKNATETDTPGYMEIRGAGTVGINSNASASYNGYQDSGALYVYRAGGGGVAAEGSFVISSNKGVSINDNSASGINVYGGGAYATYNAFFDKNTSLKIDSNSLNGTGMEAYGGGVAGMFVQMSDNGAVSISGNSISLQNTNETKSWNEYRIQYDGGASVGGGAIAVKFFSELTTKMSGESTMTYVPATLKADGNASVTLSNNAISATYTGNVDSSYTKEPCMAQGGALYLEGYTPITKGDGVVGAEASISGTHGAVTFSNNSAVSSSSELKNDKAQGGAVFIGEAAKLNIDYNEGVVSFTGNSVSGTEAQGGAIYNEGELSIEGNQDVVFSNNQAVDGEGDHLYNEAGACVEIAGNKSVTFSADSGKSSVVNKGDMYLSSAGEGSITFHNTELAVKDNGTTYIGRDAENNKGASTLSFTNTEGARTDISAKEATAELGKLTVSASEIMGEGQGNTTIQGLGIEATAALNIQMLTMKSDVGISGADTTLNSVVIDLTGIAYDIMDTGTGRGYVYNLDTMAAGGLTLSNVTFMSSDSDLSSYINGTDWIAFNFGGDVDFGEVENVQMEIAGATAQFLTAKTGAVYFGENVTPPDINVPEPATGILALAGLAGLAGRRRRK